MRTRAMRDWPLASLMTRRWFTPAMNSPATQRSSYFAASCHAAWKSAGVEIDRPSVDPPRAGSRSRACPGARSPSPSRWCPHHRKRGGMPAAFHTSLVRHLSIESAEPITPSLYGCASPERALRGAVLAEAPGSAMKQHLNLTQRGQELALGRVERVRVHTLTAQRGEQAGPGDERDSVPRKDRPSARPPPGRYTGLPRCGLPRGPLPSCRAPSRERGAARTRCRARSPRPLVR